MFSWPNNLRLAGMVMSVAGIVFKSFQLMFIGGLLMIIGYQVSIAIIEKVLDEKYTDEPEE